MGNNNRESNTGSKKATKSKQKMLNNNELSYFCSQMALVLHSGISSIEGVSMMLEDNNDKRDIVILEGIMRGMEEHGCLFIPLREVGVFPEYMVNMVQIGEETGTLDDVMDALCRHYEREESIRTSISHAVTYPLIMSGMILAVIIVLLVKVMPIFSQVFAQLGTELTGFAGGLVAFGDFINRYSPVFIVILVVVIALIFFGIFTKAGRQFFTRFGRIFKGFRELSLKVSCSRFADGMALTLKSGLTPDRSFELVSSLNEDPDFAKKLDVCRNEINEGKGMSDALHTAGIFSGIYARMVSTGNKTGSMDNVMEHIAELYQEEIDTRINNALALIEPTLIVVLSVIVGVILMSVMFPLLGIMSSL